MTIILWILCCACCWLRFWTSCIRKLLMYALGPKRCSWCYNIVIYLGLQSLAYPRTQYTTHRTPGWTRHEFERYGHGEQVMESSFTPHSSELDKFNMLKYLQSSYWSCRYLDEGLRVQDLFDRTHSIAKLFDLFLADVSSFHCIHYICWTFPWTCIQMDLLNMSTL